ncbi:MAG: efflux RND transporter permease subunit [Verrucomicrobiota bacterium]|nr:efflux RND transporter permease subunit [Verrucomicrobiota bacterium]
MKKHSYKTTTTWMAKNPVIANLLMILLLGGGLITLCIIKQEVFPNFTRDVVNITVAYPSASPEEVEQGINLAVEEAVRGLDGVDEVSSTATEGGGNITVKILEGEDPQSIAQDVKSEVDRIISFPEDAEEPVVALADSARQVMSIIVYGDQKEKVLRAITEETREQLLQDPGITKIELSAVKPFEISIEISQDTLRKYSLILQDVADIIKQSSKELPAGSVKTKNEEILFRLQERCDYGREFAKIPIICNPDGTKVMLEDIAEIKDDFEDIDSLATYNGKTSMMIDIYRVGKQTPIKVSSKVKKQLKIIEKSLPPGVGFEIWNDRSEHYRQRMQLLLKNGFIGLILVLLILGFFLELRLAFWVTLGIPISFLAAIFLMPFFGVSLNMISLFAFIIALGIVVDDAIVVGENIYDHHQRGDSFANAAVAGAEDIKIPVVFSVLTNIVAFVPLFFVSGFMGKVFSVIPSVVVMIFAFSIVECLYILPAHLGHQKERKTSGLFYQIHCLQQLFSNSFTKAIKKYYGPFLRITLKNRYITISFGVAVLIITLGYVASNRLGRTLFPKVESDYALVTAILPYGTSLVKTKKVRDILIGSAKKTVTKNGGKKLCSGIYATIGSTSSMGMGPGSSGPSSASNVVKIYVMLTEPEKRTVNTGSFTKKWRTNTQSILGLESIVFQADSGGPGSGKSLTVELSHKNMDILEKASAELAEKLSEFPKVKDIDDGFNPGKQQLDFKILPEGRSLRLTPIVVANQIRNSFYGREILRQQRGRNEVKVYVRYPKKERISEYDFENKILRTPQGGEIPFSQAVTVTRGRAYTSINRRNGQRVVTITANVIPQHDAGQIIDDIKQKALPALKEKYRGLSYSFEGKQADMRESMQSLAIGFIIAILGIYLLLAMPFRNYTTPIMIMISIPFGIVGAVIGHLIMGYSLSILSLFGIIALSGVVVNDSMILLNYAEKELKKGKNAFESINAAGIRRFRPIILTTLTTSCGLAPMILETSRQARFMIPMAISLGFGIIFATTITLVLLPSIFLITNDIRNFFD